MKIAEHFKWLAHEWMSDLKNCYIIEIKNLESNNVIPVLVKRTISIVIVCLRWAFGKNEEIPITTTKNGQKVSRLVAKDSDWSNF